MKTAATPLRSLLLSLGALAAVVAVAWSVNARTESTDAVASDHQIAQPAQAAQAVQIAVSTPEPATKAPVVEAPAEAGMKAYLDPETGELTSAPSRTAAPLAIEPTVRPDRLPEITLEDGSVMVHLQGHFEESLVMTVDANGRRVLACTQHPGEIHAHPPAAVDTREVE